MYVPAGQRIRAIKRGGGLGQVYCPSVLQGAGIVDCTDPCQQGYGECAGVQPAGIPSLPVGTSAISQMLSTLATPAPGSAAGSADLSLPAPVEGAISWLPWLLGGVAVIVVLGVVSAK